MNSPLVSLPNKRLASCRNPINGASGLSAVLLNLPIRIAEVSLIAAPFIKKNTSMLHNTLKYSDCQALY